MRLTETVLGAGQPADKPLVIVHGLFGSAKNWGALSRRFAETRKVVTVDMRNHGDSPRGDSQTYHDMAGDLAETIHAHGGQADLLGHSMGGKAAMTLALTEGALIDRLIVADIAPVAYGHSQTHLIEALQAVDLTAHSRRSEVDRALAATIPDRVLRGFLLQSLNVTDGALSWRLNLEVLKRDMAAIIGFPELQGTFDGGALFLRGANSDYVADAYRPVIADLFPNAALQDVAKAGHWLHAEQPEGFFAAVDGFLRVDA